MSTVASTDFDVVIVGGGIVGLAIAAETAREGRRTLLLERHPRFATETSSRNSGVLHAGLYYPHGTRKARLSVRGRRMLEDRCIARSIPHRMTGKLVLACTTDELSRLEALFEHALGNGVERLTWLDRQTLRRREPLLRAEAALDSAASGIVDVDALATDLANEARDHGAVLLIGARFLGADRRDGDYRVRFEDSGGESSTMTRAAVNSAGLEADEVSRAFGIDVDVEGLTHSLNKGDYFVLAASAPRPNAALVYPLPHGEGLGIHLTSDLGNVVRAGPDTEWVDEPRYDVDESKRAAFGAAVRRYLPSLRDEHLTPDYAGVRPRLGRSMGLGADFVVEECSRLGLPGFVHLLGIESPGLTASLAIAEEVARALRDVT